MRSRSQALATAALTTAEFTRLVSTAEGMTAPGGSSSFDFGSRAPVHSHFADAIAQVHQFANRRPPVVSRARALQTSNTFDQGPVSPHGRIEAGFFQIFRRVMLGTLAIRADHAHQALRHDAV